MKRNVQKVASLMGVVTAIGAAGYGVMKYRKRAMSKNIKRQVHSILGY